MRLAIAMPLLGALACRPTAPSVHWSRAYVVLPIVGSPAALYARIINDTDRPDTLLGIRTEAAREAEIHASMTRETIGAGAMSMAPVERLAVPAHGTLVLSPGGYHGMLTGLRPGFAPGDSITVLLRFARAGPINGRAAVITYADVDTATAP